MPAKTGGYYCRYCEAGGEFIGIEAKRYKGAKA
jgi:hypothetical protein